MLNEVPTILFGGIHGEVNEEKLKLDEVDPSQEEATGRGSSKSFEMMVDSDIVPEDPPCASE